MLRSIRLGTHYLLIITRRVTNTLLQVPGEAVPRRHLTLVPVGSGDLAANSTWTRTHDLGEMLVQASTEVADRYRLRAGRPVKCALREAENHVA